MVDPKQVTKDLQVRVLRDGAGIRQLPPADANLWLKAGDMIVLTGHVVNVGGEIKAGYICYDGWPRTISLCNLELATDESAAPTVCRCDLSLWRGCTCGVFAAEMAAKAVAEAQA